MVLEHAISNEKGTGCKFMSRHFTVSVRLVYSDANFTSLYQSLPLHFITWMWNIKSLTMFSMEIIQQMWADSKITYFEENRYHSWAWSQNPTWREAGHNNGIILVMILMLHSCRSEQIKPNSNQYYRFCQKALVFLAHLAERLLNS